MKSNLRIQNTVKGRSHDQQQIDGQNKANSVVCMGFSSHFIIYLRSLPMYYGFWFCLYGVCVCVRVSWCHCMFLILFLWILFFYLFCLWFVLISLFHCYFYMLVFIPMRKQNKWYGFGCVGNWGIWGDWGERKHNENIFCEKNLFLIKNLKQKEFPWHGDVNFCT